MSNATKVILAICIVLTIAGSGFGPGVAIGVGIFNGLVLRMARTMDERDNRNDR